MLPQIAELEAPFIKKNIPAFQPGDTVRVSVRIVEGEKERTQDYEGLVIGRSGGGLRETFTVRRISFGVGMERIFHVHSPRIEEIKITRRGRVRRAKLYYLRNLSGRRARLTEVKVNLAKANAIPGADTPAKAEA